MAQEPRYLLGIDLGTTGVKSLLLDADGVVAGSTTVPLSLSIPRPGWSEQDPAEWWTATGASVRNVIARTGIRPETIAGVGISGQMHGAVLLDATGEVVRPCILWNDQRSAPQCDEITRRAGGRERLLELVANPALAGFTAPKLLWVRENEPEVWERVATVLLPKDYLVYRLTGELGTEVSDAAGTLLLDVRRRVWSEEMLALLDLPRSLVPVCRESSDVAGHVTAEAAATCGLAAGTAVVAGGADNACAAVGTGVIAPGRLMGSIGTSGTMVAPTASPEVDPGGRAHTFCHAVPDTWYVMGVMLSAGGALRWFRDVWCQAEAEQAAREGRDAYDVLMELAAAAPAGAEGLLFLPYLSGERTPHGDPHARGVFCGLTLHHGKGHLIRAVVEGVTFGLRDSLEIIRTLGLPAGEVYATGGGARSPLWRQILADVFGVPVVAELAAEGPALGAALLAGAGTDVFSLQDGAARAVRTGAVVRPQLDRTEVYERAYAAYTRLYPALSDLFPLLEAIS